MQASQQEQRKVIHRRDYRPPDWLVDTVDLHFDIIHTDTEQHVDVSSTLTIQRNGEHDRPLVLSGRQMELLGVCRDGQPLTADGYELSASELRITGLPATTQLLIRTRLKPAENTSLEGLYAAGEMLCTQCEAHGFSRITYFPDRPDVLSRYRVTIEADAQRYPYLLCNGNRTDHTELGNGRHSVQWEDPFAKPCYLFALVAGKLGCVTDDYTTGSGRKIDLAFYTDPGKEGLCGHAIDALKQAMAWDERTYGLEYDLDTYMVVAVSSFNMGAMENKGLNIFNDRYVLVSPETATDTDYELVTAIIGHEYFHNWTGNRVTCRDWFQLSLKEGLTVFREQQFMQDCVGGSTQRIEQVRMLRERQFPEDAGPLAHPVRPDSYIEINNFYTATVYEKGAELVRMLHGMLGQDAFALALRDYLTRHDGQAATIEDFVAAMQRETDIDLEQFFLWYGQAGTPQVTVTDNYDAKAGEYRLKLAQHTAPTPGQTEKQPLLIPLQTEILSSTGTQQQLVTLTNSEQELTLAFNDSAPTPVFLRGFSAPVKLAYPYSDEQLAVIVTQSEDGYSRWEAMQRLYLRQIQSAASMDSILSILRQLLVNEADAGLLAELLTLPSENQVLDQSPAPLDLDHLLQQRDALLTRLGSSLGNELRQRVEPRRAGDTGYSPVVAAERRLANTCLQLLLRAPDADLRKLAALQYQQANNMSDALAAMQSLRDVDCPEREQVMSDFYQRWSGNPLVLDKWFALQACTQMGDTAGRVRQLMLDSCFDLRNPNRVRALIGAFVMNNPRGLHSLDGSGYQLLAELLPQLDVLNPQVSARMAQCLSSWRRLDATRRQSIEGLLTSLRAVAGLSADLEEILAKLSVDAPAISS